MSDFELEYVTGNVINFLTHEMILHSSTSDVHLLYRALRECKEVLSEFSEFDLLRWVPDVGMAMQLMKQNESIEIDCEVLAKDVSGLKSKIYGIIITINAMGPLLPMRKIESGLENIELMFENNADITKFFNNAADITDEVGDNQAIIDMRENIVTFKRVADNLALLCYWLEMQVVRKSVLSWKILEMPKYHKKKHKRIPRLEFPDNWSYQKNNKYFISDSEIDSIYKLINTA